MLVHFIVKPGVCRGLTGSHLGLAGSGPLLLMRHDVLTHPAHIRDPLRFLSRCRHHCRASLMKALGIADRTSAGAAWGHSASLGAGAHAAGDGRSDGGTRVWENSAEPQARSNDTGGHGAHGWNGAMASGVDTRLPRAGLGLVLQCIVRDSGGAWRRSFGTGAEDGA